MLKFREIFNQDPTRFLFHPAMARSISAIVSATAGLALGVALAQPAPLNAATIVSYTFDVEIDSGPLQPNKYFGTFSYDVHTANLTSFSFNFQGTQYDANDAPEAIAVLDNGAFLGLDYAIDTFPAFSFVPGFLDLSEAFFAYNLEDSPGRAGFGTVTYTVPGPLPLFGVAACLGYSRRLRRRMKRSFTPDSTTKD
jgi:hypothetical protein